MIICCVKFSQRVLLETSNNRERQNATTTSEEGRCQKTDESLQLLSRQCQFLAVEIQVRHAACLHQRETEQSTMSSKTRMHHKYNKRLVYEPLFACCQRRTISSHPDLTEEDVNCMSQTARNAAQANKTRSRRK